MDPSPVTKEEWITARNVSYKSSFSVSHSHEEIN